MGTSNTVKFSKITFLSYLKILLFFFCIQKLQRKSSKNYNCPQKITTQNCKFIAQHRYLKKMKMSINSKKLNRSNFPLLIRVRMYIFLM